MSSAAQMMRGILVVGSGAREHAILWGIARRSPQVPLYAAPGNPGMAELAQCLPLKSSQDIAAWARGKGPLLVVIGPEGPLAEGLSDLLRADGHVVVGPSREAAQLESSKAYAKKFMDRHGIPTAGWEIFYGEKDLAAHVARQSEWPLVLKQSRLAQGKGVVVAADADQALSCIAEWSADAQVYADGVIAETCLEGREVSVHILTNGSEYVWLPLAQDYKRLTEDPQSPNTGGMGAYAPVDWLSAEDREDIRTRILDPIMQAIGQEGLLYRGVLYVGIMMTDSGPLVLEFNVRMGDPETEVLIPILDIDWTHWWWELGQGRLAALQLPQPDTAAVAVVLASEGYPRQALRGQPITITPTDDSLVFHAATRLAGGRLEADGGRVLAAVGLGRNVAQARVNSYRQVEAISFPASCTRMDIARDAGE